jgi:hypothetical protein
MKYTFKKILAIGIAIAAILTSQSAMADIFKYEFTWAGTDHYGSTDGVSNARAWATVTVNQPSLTDPTMAEVTSISMTVENASAGNGTFSKDDFQLFELTYRFLPVLVTNQRYEITGYNYYGFGFFGNTGTDAPSSFQYDRMWAGSVWDGTALYVESAYVTRTVAAAVPEPETCAMLAAGLGLIGVVGRRRSRSKTRITA